ncbi:MAG: hypothetical protein PVH79_02105 [Candidatus Bathyarchaeota archaeon]
MERIPPLLLASLVTSTAGIVLSVAYIYLPTNPINSLDGITLWLVFTAISLLGAMVTLMPHLCSQSFMSHSKLDPSRYTMIRGFKLIHGHHPDCVEFEHHEFRYSGRRYCAGCIGLFVGALIAVVIASSYLLFGWEGWPIKLGYLGATSVVTVLGLLTFTSVSKPVLRALFNVILVVGFSLIVISVAKNGGLLRGLIAIGLCVFWMSTRIQISQWSHNRVCAICDEECEEKIVEN